MTLSRLWQPRRGLFWVMVAFNVLSSLGAWALRALPLNATGLWLVGTYVYVYSDLVVRRIGVYVCLAAFCAVMAQVTVRTDDEREVTVRLCMRENWLRSSSPKPSLRCRSASPPRLAKGSTAMLADSTFVAGRTESPSQPASRSSKNATMALRKLITAMSA